MSRRRQARSGPEPQEFPPPWEEELEPGAGDAEDHEMLGEPSGWIEVEGKPMAYWLPDDIGSGP